MNLSISKVKIIVTSPMESINEIRQVMVDAGAGVIGNYTHCTLLTDCIGTFKGNDKSSPVVGEKNKLEVVEEVKVEVPCDLSKVKIVLQKLREVHPYEEPAIDIVPLIGEKEKYYLLPLNKYFNISISSMILQVRVFYLTYSKD